MKALLSIYLIGVASLCHAQDIESIAKASILKGQGALSFNQIYNHANGKIPSRNPYSYLLNGNVNLQILGFINAPFNFMYSNHGNQYTQPTFNQTSIHPNYKWVSTHFGSISCNYSSYTVSGHLFQGAAIDLTPGKFSFSTFYGRFQKAVHPTGINVNVHPAYKRMGAGLKIGYKDAKAGNWSLVLFTAKDLTNSVRIPDIMDPIPPQQNWCGGIQIQRAILKKLTVSADIATSMLTENMFVSEANTVLPATLRFNTTNASTSIYKAVKTGLAYALGKGNVNIAYQRIDPFYKTLGAYYFTNDMENITAGFGSPLFKQKLNITANAGLQHDNLNKTRLSTMKRFAGNANMNFRPNTRFNMNLNYSNFLSYTNIRPYTDYQNQINPYIAWDTLQFRQISQNLNSSFFIILHADSIYTSSLTQALTYQVAGDQQNDKAINANAFYNANIGYTFSRVKTGESLTISLNAGQTLVNADHLVSVSPVINVSKPFFNKTLRPALSVSYTNSFYDRSPSGAILNLRGMVNYTLQKMHHFSVSFLVLNRKDSPMNSLYTTSVRSNETTVSMAYSVSMEFFDIKRIKKGNQSIN